MILRPMMMFGQGQGAAPNKSAGPANTERYMTLLIEGAAQRVPEVDPVSYKVLRTSLSQLAMQAPDKLPDKEKFELVQKVLRELDNYQKASNTAIKDQLTHWHAITELLLRQLVERIGLSAASPVASPLVQRAGRMKTCTELREFRDELDRFLHPGEGSALDYASPLRVADHSSINDNASGLMGGGAAVERLGQIMRNGGRGFVVFFRLTCLEVIADRFGMDVVQDCLMAVSNYLTEALRGDDFVFHWSDSSLVAILQARPNENILTVELRRIASNHRDIAIQINGRPIMLRVPLEFDITPISRLVSAEDIYRLTSAEVSAR